MADFTLNNLFSRFIKEWSDEAKAAHSHSNKFSSHIGLIYKKAYDSITKYPLPITSALDAIKVNGIGKTLVTKLEKRLKDYNAAELDTPSQELTRLDLKLQAKLGITSSKLKTKTNQTTIDPDIVQKAQLNLLNRPQSPEKMKKIRTLKVKEYVPAFRSGAYSILMALMNVQGDSFMDKSDIIRIGQPFCDVSFDVPDLKSKSKFVSTAWSSMKTLTEKELVYKYGHPARYCLTEEGRDTAIKLTRVTEANKLELSSDYSSESDHAEIAAYQTRNKSLSRELMMETKKNLFDAQDSQFNRGLISSQFSVRAKTFNSEQKIQSSSYLKRAADLDIDTKSAEFKRRIIVLKNTSEGPKLNDDIVKLSNFSDTIGSEKPAISDPISDISELPCHVLESIQTNKSIHLPMGSFEICIILDNREIRGQKDRTYFQDMLLKAGISCLTRTLQLGDVTWIARPKNHTNQADELLLDIIIERKTLDDLVMSIKDGRFKEQKFRLARSGLEKVVYLIEENSWEEAKVFGMGSIVASYCNTMIESGFLVQRTSGCEATVAYLISMTRFLQVKYDSQEIYGIPSHAITKEILPDLQSYYKRECPKKSYMLPFTVFQEINMKTKTNTLQDIWTKQLLTIRGISAEKSSAITKHYPTMRSLKIAYNQCTNEKGKENLLKDTVSGAGRSAIHGAISKKVYELFNAKVYNN